MTFAIFIVGPSLFVKKAFNLMDVHTDIAPDVSLLIYLSLPSMYLEGISSILKAYLINFGKSRVIAKTSIITILIGVAGCILLSLILKLGLAGVILSIAVLAGTSITFNVANYMWHILPVLRSMEASMEAD